MNAQHYCHQKALTPGSSFYYAHRFAAKKAQDALAALMAFYREINDIIEECRESSIARVKLQWWRDEIERLYTATPQHPITQALQLAAATDRIPKEYWLEIIDGNEMWLDGSFYDAKDLTLYAHRVGAMTCLTAAEMGHYQDRQTLKFAHELGTAIQLTQLLRRVREHTSAGRMIIPQSDLDMASLSAQDLLQPQSSEALRKLFRYQAARIKKHFEEAWQWLPQSDAPTQIPVIILGRFQERVLTHMEQQNYALLEHRFTLTPLRKLWMAWRTARQYSA